MKSIGIGDIQKNTSLFKKLTEAMEIVDKRKKQVVAVVYPVKKTNIVSKLAGKYRQRVSKTADIKVSRESALRMAMEEKYGRTDWY